MIFVFTFELQYGHSTSIDWIASLVLGISLVLGLVKSRYIPEWWWTIGLAVAVHFILYTTSTDTLPYLYILCNLLFLAHAVWRIIYGIQSQYKYHFMSGIAMLLLLAIARFTNVDSYLIAGIIFIIGGILLLFLNNYWNKKYEIS